MRVLYLQLTKGSSLESVSSASIGLVFAKEFYSEVWVQNL